MVHSYRKIQRTRYGTSFNDPERERLNWWQSIVFSALGIVGFVLGAILIAAVSGLTQGS